MKRLFLGIPLPEEVKEKIRVLLKEIYAVRGDFSFVPVENLHITVKFLGDVAESEIHSLSEKVLSVVQNYHPFPALVQGVSAFPRPERIAVLWVGVQCAELLPLFKDIHGALEYVWKEEREDVPHVTLLRVKSGRKQGKLQHLLQRFQNLRFGKMTIDRVVLYESHLLPEGPVYKVVQEFCFGTH